MVHATLYEWFGARDDDLARAEQASSASAGARAGSGRGPRGPRLRAVAVAALRRGRRRNSRTPSASIRICSTPTTTSRDRASRRARSCARPSCFAGGRRPPGGLSKPDAARAIVRCSDGWRKPRAEREGIRRAEHMLVLNPSMGGRCRSARARCSKTASSARRWSGRERAGALSRRHGTLVNGACLHAKRARRKRRWSCSSAFRARLGQARLGGTRSGLRQPARRPPVQRDDGAAEVAAIRCASALLTPAVDWLCLHDSPATVDTSVHEHHRPVSLRTRP